MIMGNAVQGNHDYHQNMDHRHDESSENIYLCKCEHDYDEIGVFEKQKITFAAK